MARPIKPTQLKVVGGTARKDRINPREPAPAQGVPNAPKHLSAKARTAWKYVSAELSAMGVLTRADGVALECLCEAYADLLAARAALKDRGSSTYSSTNEAGGVIHRPFPEQAMVSDADKRLKAWLASFGLTPADRARVSSTIKESGSAWDDF